MTGELKRQIGFGGAVVLGLGSILGTGVFVALGLGAGVLGPGVVLALMAGGVLALINGLNSAQLAAAHPKSGGTYEYGYEFLTPHFGFAAGALFLFAKSASAATAVLGLGGYLFSLFARTGIVATTAETGPSPMLGIFLLILLGFVGLAGIRPAFRLTAYLVGAALSCIAVFIVAALPAGMENFTDHFIPFFQKNGMPLAPMQVLGGIGEATALMFVAYTGYGRIATLGEEIERPERNIPRAVMLTLALSFVVYAAVAVAAIAAGGAPALFAAARVQAAPLEVVAGMIAPGWLPALVAIGALLAMCGVLLNLILGLSRIVLAMARRGDLPAFLGRINEAGSSPISAVLAVLMLIGLLALTGDVKFTWSFSAFFVLLYYAITNLCALRLPEERRMYPRWLAVTGLVACALLAFQIDWRAWLPGCSVLLLFLGFFELRRRLTA